MAKASVASKKTRSSSANKNYSANLADGRSVSVKDGVKTYSQKPLQVTGKDGISISGKEYSRDRGGSGFAPVITPEKLSTPPAPPNLPPPAVNNPGDVVGANNAALAPGLAAMGINYDAKGGFQPAPANAGTGSGLQDLLQQRIQMMSAAESPDYERLYNQTYKESGKRQAERDVNEYTAQINSIVANRDANMLRVEGQGRGIPEVIIGGQQAQIQKEAAIAALPVQAQLAAAQGRLDQASEYLNTMFNIKKADADNKYNRQLKIIDTYFDYADKQEQRQFDELKVKKAQQYEEQQRLLNTQNQLMQMALSNRAPKAVQDAILASKDTTSAIQAAGVYGTDMLAREAQLANIAQSRAATANSYDAIRARAEQNKAMLGTINGKAQTETEKMTETYANRMLEANQIINQVGNDFAKPQAMFGSLLPNMLKTENRQKFEQAQRNFINAVLRKESGAVISDEEFLSARLQYFPQPGDSAGVLAQKSQNRNTAISSLYNAANVPMPELSAPAGNAPLQPGQQYTTQSGLSYTILPNQ